MEQKRKLRLNAGGSEIGRVVIMAKEERVKVINKTEKEDEDERMGVKDKRGRGKRHRRRNDRREIFLIFKIHLDMST